jgi:hypothetical protein
MLVDVSMGMLKGLSLECKNVHDISKKLIEFLCHTQNFRSCHSCRNLYLVFEKIL